MSRVGDPLQPLTRGSRRTSHHAELGLYVPQNFGQWSWYRFRSNRREIYKRDIGGMPTRQQAGLIDVLISAEWDWKRFEAEEKVETGRVADEKRRMAAECRRQYLLAGREFDRTLPKPELKTKDGPPQQSLEHHFEAVRQRRADASA